MSSYTRIAFRRDGPVMSQATAFRRAPSTGPAPPPPAASAPDPNEVRMLDHVRQLDADREANDTRAALVVEALAQLNFRPAS